MKLIKMILRKVNSNKEESSPLIEEYLPDNISVNDKVTIKNNSSSDLFEIVKINSDESIIVDIT